MISLIYALQATASQVLLYLLVPAWALARMSWRDVGEWLFASLVAGVTSAAVLGWVCNETGIGVSLALGLWLTTWICGGLAARFKFGEVLVPPLDWVLLAVLVLAWVVRMIHPLQTWALGQSDAYSHLGFLRDVLERGQVGNGDYPPAYSWVMAFPACLMHGHPYWMSRFGGAFFGMGMTLGVYVFLSQLKNRATGISAAALLAGCPVFWMLQKTGVGSFANQMGLLLIPAVLWAYASGRRGWLVLTLAALALSVPMMLLHLLILLTLLILSERENGIRLVLLATMLLVFMLALGLAMRIPADRGMVVASMLTGQYGLADEANVHWGRVLQTLALDFFSFKRMGFDSWLLNAGVLGMTFAFAASAVAGWCRRDKGWRITGIWGLLTSLNVCFGIFQFTNYQREGWSLLLASACLAGLLFDLIWRMYHQQLRRGIMITGLVLVSAMGLMFPPGHYVAGGVSESDVVRFLLPLDPSVKVLARNMQGFESGQGDVVRTLHTNSVSEISKIPACGALVFLRDRADFGTTVPRVMKLLQPGLAAESERARARGEKVNRKLESVLEKHVVRVIHYSPSLDVWHICMDN